MKIKKEYLIIAVVIVLAIIYLAVRKSNRTEYQLPVIPQMALEQVGKIEVTHAGKTLTLEKKDKKWQILPQGYLADPDKVNTMLNDLSHLTLTALTSESKAYARYDLETDKAIRVQAWAGAAVQRDIRIGKAASTYQHTFIRIGETPQVYQAEHNLRGAFDQTVEQLRDKTVMQFDTADIKEIDITQNGQKTAFLKKEVTPPAAGKSQPSTGAANTTASAAANKPAAGAVEVQWTTDQGKPADLSQINRLLSILSHLSCESYIEGKTKNDMGQAPVSTLLVKGKKDYTLTLYPQPGKAGSGYPAISSESEYPFTLPDYQGKTLAADPQKLTPSEKKAEAPPVAPVSGGNIPPQKP